MLQFVALAVCVAATAPGVTSVHAGHDLLAYETGGYGGDSDDHGAGGYIGAVYAGGDAGGGGGNSIGSGGGNHHAHPHHHQQQQHQHHDYHNNHEEQVYAPQPYKFGYEIVDEYGNKQSRHEVSDEHNTKKGSYSFTDANGISRRVEYVADANGFRATIHTNEPGTASSHPADAHYVANPVSYGFGDHHRR